MNNLIPYLTKDEIKILVQNIAEKISKDYINKDLVLIGVLKGSFIFLADLIRYLSCPVKVGFVQVSSYNKEKFSSGNIKFLKTLDMEIDKKDILIIEDIIDTGLTIIQIIDYIKTLKPRSIKICTLLNKIERRSEKIKIDYHCNLVEQGFVVGYGLDYAEEYRNLDGIYKLETFF